MSNPSDTNPDKRIEKNLEMAVLKYRNRFTEIREENENLKAKRNTLKTKVKTLKAQISFLQENSDREEYVRENNKIKEKNKVLKLELKSLKKKYEDLEDQYSRIAKYETLLLDLQEKSIEKDNLLKTEENKCKLLEEFQAKLEKQIYDLQEENNRLWIALHEKADKITQSKQKNVSKKKIYQVAEESENYCNFCQVCLESELDFQSHISQHLEKLKPIVTSNYAVFELDKNQQPKMSCGLCSYISSSTSSLFKHIRVTHLESVEVPNVCPICLTEFQGNRPYSNAISLIRHIKTKHGKMVICGFCKESFINTFTRDRHMHEKHKDEVFKKRSADSSLNDNESKKCRLGSPEKSFAESTTHEDNN